MVRYQCKCMGNVKEQSKFGKVSCSRNQDLNPHYADQKHHSLNPMLLITRPRHTMTPSTCCFSCFPVVSNIPQEQCIAKVSNICFLTPISSQCYRVDFMHRWQEHSATAYNSHTGSKNLNGFVKFGRRKIQL